MDAQNRELLVLAAIMRADGELRVSLCEYNGHKYVLVQVWTADVAGHLTPDPRRRVTIKLRELRKVVGALVSAQRETGSDAEARR